MDAVLFGGEPVRDKSVMVQRVTDYVRHFYEGEVSDALLQEWETQAVRNVWGNGPKVTKYVPTLAQREVRSRVVSHLEARLAAGEALPPAADRDTWIWSTMRRERAQCAVPAA